MSSSTPAVALTPLKASEAFFLNQHAPSQREALEQELSKGHLRFHISEEEESAVFSTNDVDAEDAETPDTVEPLPKSAPVNHKALVASMRSPSYLTASHPDATAATLVWQNLTVSVQPRGAAEARTLLKGISGCMSGGLWAVMGPSGCGKSTLLNTLACRLDVNTTVSGEMRLNGRPYHHAELKKMSGYVMQDDLLNPNLTVRETLYYTAALRLPKNMSAEDRDVRVDEVIREMGLLHCQNVIVGDPSKKGISGGERRRVCIGMELLTRPSLLFLDEPTSGLDSTTAFSLMELLQRICHSGKCSMMVSIHQPQAKLFALFDRLILLKSGTILFEGSIPAALQLFEDSGFPVPHYSNPADHILDVITPPMDPSLAENMATQTQAFNTNAVTLANIAHGVGSVSPPVAPSASYADKTAFDADLDSVPTAANDVANSAKLLANFKQADVDLGFGSEVPLLLERDQVSWFRQFSILVRRNFQDAQRRKWPLVAAIAQAILIALCFGFAFFDIGTGQSSVVRRNPAAFFYCVNQGVVGGLAIIGSFPSERLLMLRERAAGSYYTSAYFCAKGVVDTLLALPVPIIFGTMAYWIIGFQPTAAKFFVFLVIVVLCNLSATSLALMISAICKTTDLATTVLPMVLEICRLFGGFYLSPANLPSYFSWLDALSYTKYSYVGIALNEFSGLTLKCDQTSGSCTPDGATSITSLGLSKLKIEECIGILISYVAFCQICAYLAMRFIKSV